MIDQETVHYRQVEEAIRFLTANFRQQPSLLDVAEHAHVSPTHFQRLFTSWAGVSPKKFLQFLTVTELKKQLVDSRNLVDAADRVGLSAQSRVYDLFVTFEAVTPHEYKTGAAGLTITYGVHDSPFGECLIATTARGLCAMRFLDGNQSEMLEALRTEWHGANWVANSEATRPFADKIFSPGADRDLKLLLRGTPFQLKVWEALLKIPFGSLATYQQIAAAIGDPKASRAVGTAVGANPLAYIIPCHRVIRREAIIGQYRWGTTRKEALIGWERARR